MPRDSQEKYLSSPICFVELWDSMPSAMRRFWYAYKYAVISHGLFVVLVVMLSNHIVCAMKQLYRATVRAASIEGKYWARGGMVSSCSDAQLDGGTLGIVGSSSQHWNSISEASLHRRSSVCNALTCRESNWVIDPFNGAIIALVTSRWAAIIFCKSSCLEMSPPSPLLSTSEESPVIRPRNEMLGTGEKTCATRSSCAIQLLNGSTPGEFLLRSSTSAVVK